MRSAILISLFLPTVLLAQPVLDTIPELQGMGVDEHYGARLPLSLPLVNDEGDTVSLGDYFSGGKPVLMSLYYSDCPMLCSLVLTGLGAAVKQVGLKAGGDYRILSVSINPAESVEQSRAGRERFQAGLPAGSATEAWRFFSADSAVIKALADTVGFRYYRVEETGEFAHPAVVFVLTPEGRISRYLYGIEYAARDLKLALVEAGEGKVGTTVDKIILYCYHYDPEAKGYTLMAANVMKLGGGLTVLGLGLLLGGLRLRERYGKQVSK